MSGTFVVGFMMFLLGACAGIIWRTVADIKHDRRIEAAFERMCNEYEHRLAIKDAKIARLKGGRT